MRGPKPAYPIELTTEEAEQLQHLIRAHKTPQAMAVRARIILSAHEHPEQTNQQIAAAVGTIDRTVRTKFNFVHFRTNNAQPVQVEPNQHWHFPDVMENNRYLTRVCSSKN